MCDKAEFAKLRDRIVEIEKRMIENSATTGEQIKTLFASVKLLYRVILIGGLILLLAVVYGALGPHGFNAVANAAKTVEVATP